LFAEANDLDAISDPVGTEYYPDIRCALLGDPSEYM